MDKLPNLTVTVPEEQKNAPLNPGDVSLRGLERKDEKFTVTFAWCDMLGGLHEETFNRGDLFADFDKVYHAFTEGGLPIDPAKISDFHVRLCQLATVMVHHEEGAAAENSKEANS